MTTLRAGSASHVGQVRTNNQDAKLIVAASSLFGVADGMGGHQGGEVAAAMAVELAEAHASERTLESLKQAARVANRAIFEKAGGDPALHGMGTTLVAVQLVDGAEGDEIAWINVGDSRAYLMRDDELRQLSHDHSLVEDLVRDGRITRDEAQVHPQRNILTRALGIDMDVSVDGNTLQPLAGDRYLLCSDGLFNEVGIDQMAAVLRRLVDPDEAADELVRLANEGGGRDNITVVVVDVVDDDGRSATIHAAQAQAVAAQEAREAAERARAAELGGPPIVFDANGGPLDDAAAALDGSGPVFADRRSSLPESHDDYGAEDDNLYADLDRVRSRRFTWRVVAFVLALLMVGAVVLGALGWNARRTYFVAFRGDTVAVFKGTPGGTLWFDPTLDHPTRITRDEVPKAYLPAIEKGKKFPTSQAANQFLVNLQDQITDSTTTTTTTSTTTSTTTTTTVATTTAPLPGPTVPNAPPATAGGLGGLSTTPPTLPSP